MPGGVTLTYHTYCPSHIELVPSLVLSKPALNHVHNAFLAMKSCQEQRRHRNMVSLRHPFRQLHHHLIVFHRFVQRHDIRLFVHRDLRLRLESDPRQGRRSSSGTSRCNFMDLVSRVGASPVNQASANPNVCGTKHCVVAEEAHLIWQPPNHQAHEF